MKNYKEKIYSNYYSHHTKNLYGETTVQRIISQFPVYEYYFGKLFPTDKNISVIDLGCGSGDFVYWLNSKGYKNTIGIDISNELIDIGKSLGISNIFCNDFFNYLENQKSKFDVIILRDVLEHFDKDETHKLVALLYNNLKNNGIVILQVPNGQSPFVGRILYGDFTHHNAFTESSISQLFKSVGFSDINVYEVVPVPKNIKGAIRFVFWKLLKTYLKILQIIASGNGGGHFSPNIIAVVKK